MPPFRAEVYRCGLGYLNESALCSLCEVGEEYAIDQGNVCIQCGLGINNPMYILISLAFAVSWFATIRFIATKVIKSFYIVPTLGDRTQSPFWKSSHGSGVVPSAWNSLSSLAAWE